jgi:hypothetical protein
MLDILWGNEKEALKYVNNLNSDFHQIIVSSLGNLQKKYIISKSQFLL